MRAAKNLFTVYLLPYLLPMAALLAMSAPARADEPADAAEATRPSGLAFEGGLFGGYSFIARDLELGVDDAPGFVSSPDFGPLFGARVAGNYLPWLSLEGEFALNPTKDRFDKLNVLIASYRLHLL